MRREVYAALLVSAVAACGCSRAYDEAASDAGGDAAGDADAASTDGAASDGAVPDGDLPSSSPVRCGATTCTSGLRCCMGDTSAFCATACPNAYSMGCVGPKDCPQPSPVCCFDAKAAAARCVVAANCGEETDYRVCDSVVDCLGGRGCRALICNSPNVSFSLCSTDGPTVVLDYPGTTPTCTAPGLP